MVAYRKTIALSTLLVVVVIHDNNRSLVKEWFEWSAAEVVEAYRQGRPVSFVVFPDSGPLRCTCRGPTKIGSSMWSTNAFTWHGFVRPPTKSLMLN